MLPEDDRVIETCRNVLMYILDFLNNIYIYICVHVLVCVIELSYNISLIYRYVVTVWKITFYVQLKWNQCYFKIWGYHVIFVEDCVLSDVVPCRWVGVAWCSVTSLKTWTLTIFLSLQSSGNVALCGLVGVYRCFKVPQTKLFLIGIWWNIRNTSPNNRMPQARNLQCQLYHCENCIVYSNYTKTNNENRDMTMTSGVPRRRGGV